MKKSSFVLAALVGLSAAHEAQALFGRSPERNARGFSCETMCTKTACDKNPKTAADATAKCMDPSNNCARSDKTKMGKYMIQDYMNNNATNWDQFFKDACSGAKTDLKTSKPQAAAAPATVTTPATPWAPATPTRPRSNSPTNAPPMPNPAVNPPSASIVTPPAPSIPTPPPALPPRNALITPPPVPLSAPPVPTTGPSAPGMTPDLKGQITNGIPLRKAPPTTSAPQSSNTGVGAALMNNPKFDSLRKQHEEENTPADEGNAEEWK